MHSVLFGVCSLTPYCNVFPVFCSVGPMVLPSLPRVNLVQLTGRGQENPTPYYYARNSILVHDNSVRVILFETPS